MQARMKRTELYAMVWSTPLVGLAPLFGISDVGLKKVCARHHIPVPHRGYWAKKSAGKSVIQSALPPRPAGMAEEIVLGGGHARYYRHWRPQLTCEEILGPLPAPPTFAEEIEDVRARVTADIGKVVAGRLSGSKHPVTQQLLEEDYARRLKQAASTYTYWLEDPFFDDQIDQRRLRILNALFLAVSRCGGKPDVSTKDGLKVAFGIHQAHIYAKLDLASGSIDQMRRAEEKPPKPSSKLRFGICRNFDRTDDIIAWQDDETGPIETHLGEIAVEIVKQAEIQYRESCLDDFDWRVGRKAELEEAERQRILEAERRERERQEQLEKARVERLLDEARSLQNAQTIREYVAAVRDRVADPSDTARWCEWALAQADRIDPISSGRYLVSVTDHESDAASHHDFVGCIGGCSDEADSIDESGQ